ncbi:putative cfem domain-containing protein [Eutypa lata UCREL1]|uniref:Putative cfem domain-containing protein n=1 Tax=Eutypa lata (strain UCR-EL1) TaxID=1287681 RepID=M7SER6_EUTLA|nr:putative cfem domain-containing protein [Eutypa lata UCREL1]
MPTCASNCLGSFLPQSTCDPTDFSCICEDGALMRNVQTCTLANCTVIEALSAQNTTQTLCGEPVRDNTVVTPVVTIVAGLLAILAVGMRLFDRFPRKQVEWADMCAFASIVFALPMGILEFITDGFGKDIWTIFPEKIERIVMFTWLTELFYFMALGLRVVLLFTLASVFAGIFHCWPIEYGWTSWTGETEGKCFNFNLFAWAHAIISIVLDIFILALPIPTLAKLQMGRRKKINLFIMFSVGTFITVVSFIRLKSFATFANTTNATYDNVPTAYWSVLEAFVSIICSCLPAVRSLLRRVLPTCFGSTGDTPGPSYRISSKNGMPSSGIKKSVTNTVSFQQRSTESDTFELVDKNQEQNSDYRNW